jgi:hypothetical protein
LLCLVMGVPSDRVNEVHIKAPYSKSL